jgi:hypothetical protein
VSVEILQCAPSSPATDVRPSCSVNTSLIMLGLSKNNIRAEGAHCLATMLRENCSLTELCLEGNPGMGAATRIFIAALDTGNFTLCNLSGVPLVEDLLHRNVTRVGDRALRVRLSLFELDVSLMQDR